MEPVRIAVIGVGYWGPKLARNVFAHADTELAAICDLDRAKAEEVASGYPGTAVFTDVDALLADDTIDAVVVATPVATHHPLAKKALQAGKHVMVEKPLTMTSAEGQDLVDLAKAKDLRLMTDHVFCYNGAVRKIRQLVQDGELGDVLYFDSVRVNLGLFQNDVNVLYDLAPHDLSILSYILPDKEALAVSATGADPMKTGLANIGYISVFYDDGMMAHIHVNWLSPTKVRMTLVGGTEKMVVWNDNDLAEKVKVYDKGVQVDEADRNKLLFTYRHGAATIPVLENTEPLALVIGELAASIREGRDPLTSGEDGLKVVKILEAANHSIAHGGARIGLA